ncbi:MAG TPA: serine hydrolase [Rhodanobacteraceae bacterium]
MIRRIVATSLFSVSLVLSQIAYAQVPPKPTVPAIPASAATVAIPPATAPSAATPQMSEEDLRTFFDGMVPYMLARNDLAGGVISVVKDGKLIFAQGYGYSDLARHTPVAADKTLFRIGSVSKLFTWTSVMQLVAEGKIDLDADVNTYLDFRIPEAFGKPVTMRELMTHTAGFGETLRDLIAVDPKGLPSLRQYLVDNLPPRIYPPGKIVAYSNYGATLAGYIVERVSGQQLHDYIADRILKPLRMSHTTTMQPLPASFQRDMSVGYLGAAKGDAVPFELVVPWPAGSVSATATDMARFMIAHLQNGQFDGTSILPAETAKLMHSKQYSAAPGMNGFDLGFYQGNRNGLAIIGHGGDTIAFHSDLELLLDKNVGIFMSFNSAGAGDLSTLQVRNAIFRAFLDRYFPYVAPQEKTVADPKADAARVAGWYIPSRRSDTALQLLYQLGQLPVAARPDGSIEIPLLQDQSGAPIRWREVGPLTYREVGGQTHLKFVTDSNGDIRYWISDEFPSVELFQRVHGLKQGGTLHVLAPISIVVLVATALIWLGGWIVRRRFRSPLDLSESQRRRRLASRVGVLAQLAVVVGWIIFVAAMSQPLAIAHSGELGGWLILLYVIGVLGVIGGIAIVLEGVPRIARGPGGWFCRAGEALLALSAIYVIWAIFAYGLANFQLHY